MPPWNLNDASIEQADIYPSYAVTAELLRADGRRKRLRIGRALSLLSIAMMATRIFISSPMAKTGRRGDLPLSRDGPSTGVVGRHHRREPRSAGVYPHRRPDRDSHAPGGLRERLCGLPQTSVPDFPGRGANFPRYETVTALAAPWDVGFDPKWGGPERIVFSELEDWSKRPEPGIQHYSGKATYKTSFDCDRLDSRMRYFLSLGRVAVIASVKVNDRDLGVVWCEPWRIAVPRLCCSHAAIRSRLWLPTCGPTA